MDDSNSSIADPTRRRFLRAAGGAGALAGAAGLAQGGAAAAPPAAEAAPPAPAPAAGYRETEHIRQYYRTARYW